MQHENLIEEQKLAGSSFAEEELWGNRHDARFSAWVPHSIRGFFANRVGSKRLQS
jgi:hypothetical protein